MINNKQYKELLELVKNGYYDGWAEGYARDLEEIPDDKEVFIAPILNIVQDFLESRIIEGEEGEKQ